MPAIRTSTPRLALALATAAVWAFAACSHAGPSSADGPGASTPAGARVAGPEPSSDADTVDILVRGGILHDGSGEPPVRADVGVAGDRVVFVGDAAAEGVHGRRELDATGMVVAPGFVDPHTHAGGDLAADERHRRENRNYLAQGVTTVVVGNDGGGSFEVAERRELMEEAGIGTNVALLVGFGAVRREVLGGADRPPTDGELERMEELVGSAMEEGAVGLSTGLFYAPQSFASTDEVVALARVAARHGGVYDTHLRDESSYTVGLLDAVREAIAIGERAGIPVNISHVKALGVDVWGRSADVVALVRAARERGLRITADQYPYLASGTSFHSALLPRWAQAGGGDSLSARLADPDVRPRLLADVRENLRRRNGPDALLVTRAEDSTLVGRTLAEIAAEREGDPAEVALEIIREGGASVGSFNMSEDDLVALMRADFVMTGSDGSGGHPRKYGTYPRKIRRYVLEDSVIGMARMIEASAGQPARVFGLRGRGVLEEGAWADLVVFDPERIRDEATFLEPRRLATGMRWVLVNGAFAVDGGEPTGALAGRVLTRGGGVGASGGG